MLDALAAYADTRRFRQLGRHHGLAAGQAGVGQHLVVGGLHRGVAVALAAAHAAPDLVGAQDDRALIVRGHANLLGNAAAADDLERVRMLFDDLEQKEQLIGLLDNVSDAQGVRIFIGAESRLFSLSGSAVIAAPYMTGAQKVVGAIGVIGPARLNYARVIPLVDYTARVLGQVMNA